MSVGGMLGGVFNGLIAPLLFIWGVIEFPVAIIVAGFLRPTTNPSGWADDYLAGMGKGGGKGKAGRATPEFTSMLDLVLPACVLVLCAILVWGLGTAVAGFFENFTSGFSREDKQAFLRTVRNAVCFGIPLIIGCFYGGRPIRYG